MRKRRCALPWLAAIVRRTKKGLLRTRSKKSNTRLNARHFEPIGHARSVCGRVMGRYLFIIIIFCLYVPAKMSCKLWLNVWTCRSFTCPFTLRNLDRNPTAALISGFIVPRAQRVCIEKATAIRERFVVFPFLSFFCPATCLSDDCSSPLQSDPCVMALVLCFSWHLIGRGSRMSSRGREPGRITFLG